MLEPDKTKVLFIVGAGRSGSTLVDQILGQAPGFCSVGELFTIWMHGLVEGDTCGCGVPVPECPFWNAVLIDAFGTLDRVQHGEARTADRHSRSCPARFTVEASEGHPAAACGSSGGRVRRDSSSNVCQHRRNFRRFSGRGLFEGAVTCLRSRRIRGCRLYVLHLVRDARAVANAWRRNPDPGGRRDHARIESQGMSLWTSTAQWVFRAAVIEAGLRPMLGDRYLQVRYEDFASNPREYAQKIISFVGEDVTSAFLDDHTIEAGDNHIVSGNRAKFNRGPVVIKFDERWKSEMPRRTV